MSKNAFFFLLLSLVLTSCSATSEEAILFSTSRNGNSDIYIMDSNGENQRALTQSQYEEWGPTWINGDEISFLRQIKDSIFRIKLNLVSKKETELQHPSNCILDDKNTLYSASKKQLYSCENDIFIFEPSNSNLINITENLKGNALYPSWSHDGKSVLFTSNHLGTNQVFIYDIATESILQLSDSKSNNERGELSPDRNFLVYSSDYLEKGNQEIVIKNLQTGKVRNISNSSGTELIARFSKNGKHLYYGSNKDGNWEIYSYNLETELQTQLTNNKEFDGDPRILKQ